MFVIVISTNYGESYWHGNVSQEYNQNGFGAKSTAIQFKTRESATRELETIHNGISNLAICWLGYDRTSLRVKELLE